MPFQFLGGLPASLGWGRGLLQSSKADPFNSSWFFGALLGTDAYLGHRLVVLSDLSQCRVLGLPLKVRWQSVGSNSTDVCPQGIGSGGTNIPLLAHG